MGSCGRVPRPSITCGTVAVTRSHVRTAANSRQSYAWSARRYTRTCQGLAGDCPAGLCGPWLGSWRSEPRSCLPVCRGMRRWRDPAHSCTAVPAIIRCSLWGTHPALVPFHLVNKLGPLTGETVAMWGPGQSLVALVPTTCLARQVRDQTGFGQPDRFVSHDLFPTGASQFPRSPG